ncbi:MAG: NTP transferase domain-containing protein [Nitrososphaerota archaeon]
MQDTTVLLLAGGLSNRMGKDKRFVKLSGTPIIEKAIQSAKRLTPNLILSIHNEQDVERIKAISTSLKIVVDDNHDLRSPLLGIYSASKYVKTNSTIVLPSDSPIVLPSFIQIIVKYLEEFDAVVPTWPDGKIEAIHAAYRTDKLYTISKSLLNSRSLDVKSIPLAMQNVLFLSTEQIKNVDPNLVSLIDIDTPNDLQMYTKLNKQVQQYSADQMALSQ